MNRDGFRRQQWSRRNFLACMGTLTLLYPVLQFIGFKIPKKPTFIDITQPLSPAGYLVAKDFVLFERGEKCWALSRSCTHLGCKVNYLEETDNLECPCHQSKFDATTGAVIKGPATRPLVSFTVEKRQSVPFYVVTIA
jgi:cytochrome b6-f complex iron-sulfur subunit